jgi:hypothetical protein
MQNDVRRQVVHLLPLLHTSTLQLCAQLYCCTAALLISHDSWPAESDVSLHVSVLRIPATCCVYKHHGETVLLVKCWCSAVQCSAVMCCPLQYCGVHRGLEHAAHAASWHQPAGTQVVVQEASQTCNCDCPRA